MRDAKLRTKFLFVYVNFFCKIFIVLHAKLSIYRNYTSELITFYSAFMRLAIRSRDRISLTIEKQRDIQPSFERALILTVPCRNNLTSRFGSYRCITPHWEFTLRGKRSMRFLRWNTS